jgi:hypothetical protein
MSGFAGSRKRVIVWVLLKLLLTVCDRQIDARAAISLDQPLTLSVSQVVREAANDHLH